jgi:hypothetical protein
MPAKRIDVVKKDQGWVGQTRGGEVVARGRTKEAAVKNTAKAAKADPQAVTVRIHKQNGKIQQERTYPRSADPRSSRG